MRFRNIAERKWAIILGRGNHKGVQMHTSILIFGASGDLTNRKLVPALYNQFKKGKLSKNFCIVGISRTAFSHDEFREKMQKGTEEFSSEYDAANWAQFAEHLFYIAADGADVSH